MSTLTRKPLDWFLPDPDQPRKAFDHTRLMFMAASLKVRQLCPIIARSDGTLIDGECRWRAAKLAGLESLDVIVCDEELSPTQVKQMQLVSSMHRSDLTGYEKWLACVELLALNPAWTQKDLAELLHVDPAMVVRYLAPSKTSPAWQQALKDGKVGIGDCYAASKAGEAEQAALLAAKLNGASAQELERRGRKARNDTSAVRTSRVKIPLSGGATVNVSGDELGMQDVVESLSEALKEAKKAAELYDVRTFQAMMKDKAGGK
jgi:ParB/RepB/Spo0J family partition protein